MFPKIILTGRYKKGQGKGEESEQDITYEGYAKGGIAVFIEASTNNTTRTVANIKNYFNKTEGSLGKDGCLQFIFEQKALFYSIR